MFNSRGWNREIPLYTEVSSFQGTGIEIPNGSRLLEVLPLYNSFKVDFTNITSEKTITFKTSQLYLIKSLQNILPTWTLVSSLSACFMLLN